MLAKKNILRNSNGINRPRNTNGMIDSNTKMRHRGGPQDDYDSQNYPQDNYRSHGYQRRQRKSRTTEDEGNYYNDRRQDERLAANHRSRNMHNGSMRGPIRGRADIDMPNGMNFISSQQRGGGRHYRDQQDHMMPQNGLSRGFDDRRGGGVIGDEEYNRMRGYGDYGGNGSQRRYNSVDERKYFNRQSDYEYDDLNYQNPRDSQVSDKN